MPSLLLLEPVPLEAYPDLQRCERVTPYLGGSLLELYGLQGIRWGTATGYLLSCLYFYGYRRPRASFADRRLLRLHHYFYPSAAVAAPAGLCLGVGRGFYVEEWSQLRQEREKLVPTMEREERAAGVAWAAYRRRRAAAAAQVDGQWSVWQKLWWGKFTASARGTAQEKSGRSGGGGRRCVYDDKLEQKLALLGLSSAGKERWEDFLEPYTLAWTHAHRQAAPSPAPHASTAVKDATATTTTTRPSSLTTLQQDYLAARVLQVRHDKAEERWCATGSRCLVYGAITFLVAWNSGGAAARLAMGVGAGVTAGSVLSALRLDETFSHV